jgi:hypothetical protein
MSEEVPRAASDPISNTGGESKSGEEIISVNSSSAVEDSISEVGSDECDSGSRAERGEEITSVNCSSGGEDSASEVSSLIDNNSVDLKSDARAFNELHQLLWKKELPRKLGRLDSGCNRSIKVRKKQNKGARQKLPRNKFVVLESSEEESENCIEARREKHFRRLAKMASKENSKVEKDKMGVEEEREKKQDSHQFVVVQHPLSGNRQVGRLKDDRAYEAEEVVTSPEDTRAVNPTKKHRTEMKEMFAGLVSPDQRSSVGKSDVSSPSESISEKMMKLLQVNNKDVAVALLDKLFENAPDDQINLKMKAKLAPKASKMCAVEGYNPVVADDVEVFKVAGWNVSKEVAEEFYEIGVIVEHGEGFNSDVVNRLLACQKRLVGDDIIGQPNRMKARDHFTTLKSAIKLGKKNIVAEEYERLLYCLLMQECTQVCPTGELALRRNKADSNESTTSDQERGRRREVTQQGYGRRGEVGANANVGMLDEHELSYRRNGHDSSREYDVGGPGRGIRNDGLGRGMFNGSNDAYEHGEGPRLRRSAANAVDSRARLPVDRSNRRTESACRE